MNGEATETAPKQLLTLEDVSRELGITPRAVMQRVRRGQLAPPLHGGGKTARWRPRDIYGEPS